MSIPAINLALAPGLKVPAGQRLVLIRLADRANRAGLAWPSVASIARDIDLSPRQVQRHLRMLERRGLLKVHSGASRNRPVTYRVFPAVTLASPLLKFGGDTVVASRVTPVPPEPTSESPKTESTRCSAPGRVSLTAPRAEASKALLLKLAYTAIDGLGSDALIADLASDLKSLCAQNRVSATPGMVAAALSAALGRRRRCA